MNTLVASCERYVLLLPLWIDDFFCLTWFYRWIRTKRERALGMVLREFGDSGMQQRAFVEAWRRADFLVRYGRSVPDELRNLVITAAASIPQDDLRLLVINRDVSIKCGVVSVRSSWGLQLLSWLAKTVFASHFVFLTLLAIAHNGPWFTTAWVVAGICCIYGFLWRGMSLYTSRPLATARRYKSELQVIAQQLKVAQIARL